MRGISSSSPRLTEDVDRGGDHRSCAVRRPWQDTLSSECARYRGKSTEKVEDLRGCKGRTTGEEGEVSGG